MAVLAEARCNATLLAPRDVDELAVESYVSRVVSERVSESQKLSDKWIEYAVSARVEAFKRKYEQEMEARVARMVDERIAQLVREQRLATAQGSVLKATAPAFVPK